MANRPAKFTQIDVTRACKGVQEAGLTVRGVEIDQNGRILVRCDDVPREEQAVKGWDNATQEDAHAA